MASDSELGDLSRKREPRIIDAKLPLTWLLFTAASIITSYAVLYGDVGRLRTDVQELKITIKASDSTSASLQGQMAILQFRVESLEAERKRLSGDSGKTR